MTIGMMMITTATTTSLTCMRCMLVARAVAAFCILATCNSV